MHIRQNERIGVFIDGANLYTGAKLLGFDIDFKRLLLLYRQQGHLVRAAYFATLHEDHEFSPVRPLLDWLEYNGFALITKQAKEFIDAQGRRKVKGSIDVELAVDALRMAPALDHAILYSGDGDFRCLVAALQQMGKRVTVVSTLQTHPAIVADELRRQADQFIELADLRPAISRDVLRGPARAPAAREAPEDEESRGVRE